MNSLQGCEGSLNAFADRSTTRRDDDLSCMCSLAASHVAMEEGNQGLGIVQDRGVSYISPPFEQIGAQILDQRGEYGVLRYSMFGTEGLSGIVPTRYR